MRLHLNHSKVRRDEPRKSKNLSVYILDAVLLVFALGVMYWIFPDFVQNIVFDVGMRNMIFIVPWIAFAYVGWRFLIGKFTRRRRIITGLATLFVLSIVWDLGIWFSRDYLIFLEFANYQKRERLVENAPETGRYTPLQNACVDLSNAISTSSEHVDCDHVQPIITGGKHFGYAAPITPSGFLQTFLMKNPGFMVFDDSPEVIDDPKRRIRRIDDPQEVGPGMEWFDNLNRVLVLTDFFANYETPHYLALDQSHPEKLTAVVSKIKYAYFFQLPYWAGVVLVHSDGKIEDLSKEDALKDPRLKGQWLHPLQLERQYVQLQDYATGYGIFSPIVRVPGKLEIEELPGNNKFPFLFQGADGDPYLVTATKGEGSARGLFRMYFRNANTGEGSYHEFKPDEVVYGASAALDRVTNIPGYNWYRESNSSSGNMIAVEPVYIMRPGETMLHWKFTVTNREFAGISATVVSHGSRPDDMKVFRTRAEFETWKHGGSTPTPVTKSREEKIRLFIERITNELGELRKLLTE